MTQWTSDNIIQNTDEDELLIVIGTFLERLLVRKDGIRYNISEEPRQFTVDDHMRLTVIRAMKKSTSKIIENELVIIEKRKESDKILLDIMTLLEVDNKLPVHHNFLIHQLQIAKFTKNKAENCIRMMLQKTKIYESKPHYYNIT